MMTLYTPADMPSDLPRLTHRDSLMLMGSCFASQMGERLRQAKFDCDVNPYGVLYNPLSISTALREIASGRQYAADDLFPADGCWHSPMHHGDFSAGSPDEALRRINARLSAACTRLASLDVLLLTFGTSWVYEDRLSGRVVGNCHKLPANRFRRRRLSVEDITGDYARLLADLWELRPGLKVVFTVSPIRHVRDGLHANQLSKATLLLAADALQQRFAGRVFYFPAYELLNDELRDYRFYADDLVHPSVLAEDYVWQRFSEACFSGETLQIAAESENIGRMLRHEPFRPGSEEYKRFLGQIVLKIDRLNGKYPYLDFAKEREICHTRLKT